MASDMQYSSHKKFIKQHFLCLTKEIDSQSSNYDKILLLGDFNSESTKETMKTFCQIQKSWKFLLWVTYSLQTNPVVCKTLPHLKQAYATFIKWQSQFLKHFSKKQSPKIISYQNYKNSNKSFFQEHLLDELSKISHNDRNLHTFKKKLSFEY